MSRVVIVTGAGQGIGQATVQRFAQQGDRVVIVDIDETKAQATAASLPAGTTQHVAVCDVSDDAGVHALIAQVVTRFGRVDVLVNNAAVLVSKPLHETTLTEWQRVIGVNLSAVYSASHAVLPHMLAQGSGNIINLASPHSFATTTNIAAYAAAKGGVVALTRQMAMDYGRKGVRTNCVVPGAIDTPMLRSDIAHGADWEASLRGWERTQPIGRLGQPHDIAKVICWLASDDASFVLGAAIHADGGLLAQLTP
jgi:NAD(P)-dependent dehydrogenase (short-subunit alcohol dehydrogenase family)